MVHSTVAKICSTILLGALALACPLAHAEEQKPALCRDDAMIVFDASGSMSGNQILGIPNSKARIDEVRNALEQVLPTSRACAR
jgi:Ca-activated chloride channel family protein